jgi:dTDP-4-dehydrorhamnose 3,5-epimerase
LKFIKSDLPEVTIIEPKVFMDERGFFMEAFHAKKFLENDLPSEFVQDNHSGSKKGTLRGIHYQTSHVQGKLIRAVLGEIFDVAVDLRRSSTYFGKWFGIILSAENKKQLWVPAGFGHGYYVLSDWAEIVYKTTDVYDPDGERCIFWKDSTLGINWPIIDDVPVLVSSKDRQGMLFEEAEVFA